MTSSYHRYLIASLICFYVAVGFAVIWFFIPSIALLVVAGICVLMASFHSIVQQPVSLRRVAAELSGSLGLALVPVAYYSDSFIVGGLSALLIGFFCTRWLLALAREWASHRRLGAQRFHIVLASLVALCSFGLAVGLFSRAGFPGFLSFAVAEACRIAFEVSLFALLALGVIAGISATVHVLFNETGNA